MNGLLAIWTALGTAVLQTFGPTAAYGGNARVSVRGFVRPSRCPWGAHPLSGAILVFVHISSMNTRRSGSIWP